jgi:hypothetical protein
LKNSQAGDHDFQKLPKAPIIWLKITLNQLNIKYHQPFFSSILKIVQIVTFQATVMVVAHFKIAL